jgi:prepilin-type processing-associated H-X9-DG protein
VRDRNAGGFTLVELLSVVAIVLLLLALLLPALGSARERVHRVVCLSNERQIVSSLLNYAGDHEGRMPGGNAAVWPGFGIDSTYAVSANIPMGTALLVGGLVNALDGGATTANYLGRDDITARVFYCPSWKHPFFQQNAKVSCGLGEYGGWTAPGVPLPRQHVGISYAYRSTFTNGPGRWNAPSTRSARPAGTAVLSDHWYLWRFDNVWYGQYAHAAGYNASYLDGHVAWVPDPDLFMYHSPVINDYWDDQEVRWTMFFDR